MNWNDLAYVLAVARDRTLVRAAKSLMVAHTTVSRRLKTLEEELGVLLFDRTPEGLVPTAAGEELVEVAERVERDVLSVEARVLGYDAELRGTLRVSTVDVLLYALASSFTAFTESYPLVDLSVATAPTPVSLTRREADVVIRLSTSPPEGLVGRRVGFVQYGVYAASSLAERLGPGTPLSAFPWIGWDGGQHLTWFEGWLASHAPGARVVLRVDDRGLGMLHAVRSGIGAQILPCVAADATPGLRRVAPLDDAFRLDLWLLTLPELRNNSRVRAFMEHMAGELTANRAALRGEGGACDLGRQGSRRSGGGSLPRGREG